MSDIKLTAEDLPLIIIIEGNAIKVNRIDENDIGYDIGTGDTLEEFQLTESSKGIVPYPDLINDEPSTWPTLDQLISHFENPPVLNSSIHTLQEQLLENYTRVEILNITPAGAIDMAGFIQAGGDKAIAVKSWITSHWAEYRIKQNLINNGEGDIDLFPSSKWKPFSYSEMIEEYLG